MTQKFMKLLICMLTTLAFGMVTMTPIIATSAITTTIPRSLRGTWYRYDKWEHHYNRLQLSRHYYLINGKTTLSSFSKGPKRIQVSRYNHKYRLNNPNYGYQDAGLFRVGKRKVNGHYRKALFQYVNMGNVLVYLTYKTHHDYSYVLK